MVVVFWPSSPVADREAGNRVCQVVQKAARASRRWASAYSCRQGKAEAMASLMRRQLMRTRAPIFKSRCRMVPQVAVAN